MPRATGDRLRHRRHLILAASGLAALAFAPGISAQASAADRIAVARAQIQARNFDSATAGLRQVVDDTTATVGERASAGVWLGVARYYAGDDSGAVQAFRAAVTLDRAIDASGLARIDPVLEELFRTARPATGPLYSCVPTCARGLRRPTMLRFRRYLAVPAPDPGAGVAQAIIDTAGYVEPGSVQIVTAPSTATGRGAEAMLDVAEFRRGTLAGAPVRVMVQLRYECRPFGSQPPFGMGCWFWTF